MIEMQGNEENSICTLDYYRYPLQQTVCGRKRPTVSAPAAIHVTALPKIATGRSINSAKKLWREHESIETISAIREKSERKTEECRHFIHFSKNPKVLKMSSIREVKQFKIIHSEVFGLSKVKQKEMYSEVKYLTNAVRNCDGTHSFKNLSTYDHLRKKSRPIGDQKSRWKSADQEIPIKRMLPPAPPGNIDKVFAWEVTHPKNDDDMKQDQLVSVNLKNGCTENFLEMYGHRDHYFVTELTKETEEKQRQQRRDELLKTNRSASAGTRFIIDSNPDVKMLQPGKLHREKQDKTRSRTQYKNYTHGVKMNFTHHGHVLRVIHDCNKGSKSDITKSVDRKEARHRRNKTAIPVINFNSDEHTGGSRKYQFIQNITSATPLVDVVSPNNLDSDKKENQTLKGAIKNDLKNGDFGVKFEHHVSDITKFNSSDNKQSKKTIEDDKKSDSETDKKRSQKPCRYLWKDTRLK